MLERACADGLAETETEMGGRRPGMVVGQPIPRRPHGTARAVFGCRT